MPADTAAQPQRTSRQWTEIVAVVLLSLVAVMTAWCGFEASKWRGEMTISFSQASSNRIKASDANSSSRDAFQLDAMVFAQWLVAKQGGDEELATYLQGVFSDPLDVAFAAWDGETKTPFGLPEYVPAGSEQVAEFTKKADTAYAAALVKNGRADNYSLLTVMFALVLFLGAVSQRQVTDWAQKALLGLAAVVALGGVVIMATFPILL